MVRKFLALLVMVSAAGPGGTALAADAIPVGARLAATCTGCHGTNGATTGDALPSLAGRSRESLQASLNAFKAGEIPATVMTQLTKGYTSEQLERIAEFFSQQVADQAPGVSPGAGT